MTRLDLLRPPRRRRRKWRTNNGLITGDTCNSHSTVNNYYLNHNQCIAMHCATMTKSTSCHNKNHTRRFTLPPTADMMLVYSVLLLTASICSSTTTTHHHSSLSRSNLANLSTVIQTNQLPPLTNTRPLAAIDLSPLAIGNNGHIGNNMQSSSFLSSSSNQTTSPLALQPTATLLSTSNNLLWSSQQASYKPIVASFATPNQTINFTHITYDKDTGKLYLGASNMLYQLDSNLKMEHQVSTGPVWDSPSCSIIDCKGYEESMKPTTNVNKVLVIDHTNQMLLACGSTRQGACRRHHLHNITSKEDLIPMAVAANEDNASTVAFIGPARYSDNQQQQQIYATSSTNNNNSNSYFMQHSSQSMLPSNQPQQVLYVAVTNSRPPRDLVPAIGTRSLDSGPNLLNLYENSYGDARIDIDSPLRDYFLVNYIYGFATSNYVYFATVQKKAAGRDLEGMGYLSRLARVCVSDASYNSYTEVDLKCTTNSTLTGKPSVDYPLLQAAIVVDAGSHLLSSMTKDPSFDTTNEKVLIGLFSTNRDHTAQAGDNSAICVYPLSQIEDIFTDNIHNCYTGKSESRNMSYIAGNVADCPKSAGNVVNFCSETLKINGSVPIIVSPAIKYINTTLTAITATTVNQNQHTVAFVGTSNGHLKKVLLNTINKGVEFEDTSLLEQQETRTAATTTQAPILSDIHLDKQARHVYVATPYKIMKVQAQRCGQYLTCRECSQSQNPFCGWCSLERRCTTRDECNNATYGQQQLHQPSRLQLMNGGGHHQVMSQATAMAVSSSSNSRWLSMEAQKCIEFLSITPNKIYIQNSQIDKIDLQIDQLPRLPASHSYKCLFGAGKVETVAQQSPTGLSCAIPRISQRGEIHKGKDHIVVDLTVKSSKTNTEFLQGKITYFDCRQHTTCKDCVNAQWNCNWCLNENVCMYNTSKCDKSGLARQEPLTLANAIRASTLPSTIASTTTAPKQQQQQQQQQMSINAINYCPTIVHQRNTEILIPEGVEREVMLKVKNVPTFKGTYQCNIEIENEKMQLKARIEEDRIICERAMYTYSEERGQIQARLTVIWNENNFIDMTNVTIYKCHLLGSLQSRPDCSICQILDPRYQCSWCSRGCHFQQQCYGMPIEKSCPPPDIADYVHPLNRQIPTSQDNTRVILEENNAGMKFEDIQLDPPISRILPTNLNRTSSMDNSPLQPEDYMDGGAGGAGSGANGIAGAQQQAISWSILSILLFLLGITMLLFVLYTLVIVFHRYYQHSGSGVLSAFNLMSPFLNNLDNMTQKPKFELIKPIGKGQFSDVYKAKWLNASNSNTFVTPVFPNDSVAINHSSNGQLFETLSEEDEDHCGLDDDGYSTIKQKKISTMSRGTMKKSSKTNLNEGFTIVALKRVKISDMKDAKSKVDCLREINLLQKLDHPNIIKYSLSFIDKNDLFIVLELADGGDLSKLIRHFLNHQRQSLTERTVLKYFTQICSAVRYIHSRNLLHRDIKPANIFMTSNGCVKLGDFGLGRYFSPHTMDAYSLLGTFYYMAPERIRQTSYGFSSDVWSVGCVLYELMALRPPFCAGYQYEPDIYSYAYAQQTHHTDTNARSDMINLQDLIDRISNGHYRPVEANFSTKLKEIIGYCLNPQPELRPKMDEICLAVDCLYQEQLTQVKPLASNPYFYFG